MQAIYHFQGEQRHKDAFHPEEGRVIAFKKVWTIHHMLKCSKNKPVLINNFLFK